MHPLAKSKFVSLEQMASEPLATYSRKDYPGFHKHLNELFASIGRKPRIGSEHDSGTSIMSAVASGHEFALLPSCESSIAGPRRTGTSLRSGAKILPQQ
jgi:DNA-binding transcriptional LysR family regulator